MTLHFVFENQCEKEILNEIDSIIEHRRTVHQNPELGFQTQETVQRIVKFLEQENNLELDTKTVKGTVFAFLAGKKDGRTIALRADIDALAMDDQSQNPWKSQIKGHAHACGHDGHQSWLIASARYLARHNDFAGNVLFIFQPAEETTKGAQAIVQSGILERYKVSEIYGMHDEPILDAGHFGSRIGPLQASVDSFYITLTGKGGHGGYPYLAVDPLPALAELILSLQTIISRCIDPLDNVVISLGSVNAGKFQTPNVIPSQASLCGTVRTFTAENRRLCKDLILRKVNGIAQIYGLEAQITYEAGCSSLINDKTCTEVALSVAQKLVGKENVVTDMAPFMTSEDFSEYLNKVPGAMIQVGIRDEGHQASLHNPYFDFNDKVLPIASTFLVHLVLERLKA